MTIFIGSSSPLAAMLILMRGRPSTIDRDLPPAPLEPDGGGGGGWALLLTAGGAIEAQLIRGLLEGSGVVPIHLDSSDPSPGAWLFLSGDPNAPVRVYVARSMLDQARLALLDAGFGLETDTGDAEPDIGDVPRWLRLMWMVAGVIIALGFALRLVTAGCLTC